MALVTASSTARARRSAVAGSKPAVSAIFFVTSRTTPRKVVSLGTDRTKLGRRAELRRTGGSPALLLPCRAPEARVTGSRRRGFLAEAEDRLHLGREDAVEM